MQRVSNRGLTGLSTTSPLIFDFIAFKCYLYVGTGNWTNDENAGQVWRTIDGQTWTQQDMLYAATINYADGLEIWRSATGKLLDWTRIISAGFGGRGSYHIANLFREFNSSFYVGVENIHEQDGNGLRILRTADGVTWTSVGQDGFGSKMNKNAGASTVFQGQLYVGTRNDTSGGQLWRSSDGQQSTGATLGVLHRRAGETLTRQVNLYAYDELAALATMRLSNDPLLIENVVIRRRA